MRTEYEKIIYDTSILWTELPMPMRRDELKKRLASRLLPRNYRAKTKVPVPSKNSVKKFEKVSP